MTDKECLDRFAAAVSAVQGVGLMLDGLETHVEISALPEGLRGPYHSLRVDLDNIARRSALMSDAALAYIREHLSDQS